MLSVAFARVVRQGWRPARCGQWSRCRAAVALGVGGLRGRARFRAAGGSSGRRLHPGGQARGHDLDRCHAGGSAQHFVAGRDIPAEWWRVFHSKEINGLIGEALQANPSLQAAQAALWQAKENLYAQQGKLLPTVDANETAERQRFSPAAFGGSGAAVHLQSVPGDGERLFHARRVRRPAAADRGHAGAGRLSAVRARSDLSDADRQRGDGRHPGSLAARPDRCDPGHHQGPDRAA